MERREIVLARVFFSDSAESKVRPAIVLSDEKYNKNGYVLAASITTSSDEFCIPISGSDANCQLDKNSNARFDGVNKLPSKQIIKKIGKITPEFYSKLVDKIIGLIRNV